MEQLQPSISTLRDLLDYDARQFTSIELLLKNNLKTWISSASSLLLKATLQKYLVFVEEHIQKLESFYEAEKIAMLSVSNHIMQAFINDTNEKLRHCSDMEVKDACLLAGIQAINHFKISMYGTAAAYAKTLEMDEYAALFHVSEVNEKQIDDRLSQLAEHEVNSKAKAPIVLPS